MSNNIIVAMFTWKHCELERMFKDGIDCHNEI